MTSSTVRMILITLFLFVGFTNTQRTTNIVGPAQFNSSIATPTSASPTFNFEPITGTLTAGQTVTATASGTLPPFQVVLSDERDTEPPFTTSILSPSSTDNLELFTFVVPTLIASDLIVLVEYATGSDEGLGAFTVGTIDITPAATSPNSVSSSSSGSPDSTGGPGSASDFTDTTSPTSATAFSSSSTQIPSSVAPANATTPTNAVTSTNAMAPGSSPTRITAPTGSEEKSNKTKNLGAIVGGTIGAAVVALLVLLALIWCKRRKRQTAGRPMTFHGDMMVKSPEPSAFPSFEPFTTRSGTRPSRSIASSRNSSIDSHIVNEKTPALAAHSRAASSRASEDGQSDNGEALYRYPSSSSSSMTEHESARGPSRLFPRTDRQMQLEEKIQILKAEMISLSDELSEGSSDSHDSQIGSLRAKIKRLEKLESSDWALSLTNDVPSEFLS